MNTSDQIVNNLAGRAPVGARILTRVTLPIVVAGVVLLAAGIYGAWRVHRLKQRGTDMLSDNVASIRSAEELETIVREWRYRLKRYRSTDDPRHLAEVSRSLQDGRERFREAAESAKTQREVELIQRIERGMSAFFTQFEEISGRPETPQGRQAVVNLADETIPNKILVFTTRYLKLNESQLNDSSERNRSRAQQLMFGLLMLGTCGGVLGLLVGYVIARRVNRTLVQLSLPIRDAAGKLNEVAGPMSVSAAPGFDDLESILQTVSNRVCTVVSRLQESEREALRAEQLAAMGQLATGLAHELRNPLTSVKAVLQMADHPDDLSERDLDVLKAEIGRLELSVQAFLDFARPPRPVKSEIDLRDVVEEVRKLVARRVERQQLQLQWNKPRQPLPIIADATQIRQVVLNLVLNAVDASPRGGTIWLQTESAGGLVDGESENSTMREFVEIVVGDAGPGPPGDLGERIFEPFVSTKAAGIGLGLSICKRIVESHGGEITAHTRPQGGAEFVVRLRMFEVDRSANRSGVAAGPEPVASRPSGNPSDEYQRAESIG